MRWIADQIVPNGGRPCNTEIVSVVLPTDTERVFRLAVEIWPDVFGCAGPRECETMEVFGARLVDDVKTRDLVGYGIHDVWVDDTGKMLRIDTTIRRIDLEMDSFSIR